MRVQGTVWADQLRLRSGQLAAAVQYLGNGTYALNLGRDGSHHVNIQLCSGVASTHRHFGVNRATQSGI